MKKLNKDSILKDDALLYLYCVKLCRHILSDFMLCGFINYNIDIANIDENHKDRLALVDFETTHGKAIIHIYKDNHKDLDSISKSLLHECFHINQYEYFEIDEDIRQLITEENIKNQLLTRSESAMEHLCMRFCNFINWSTDYLDCKYKEVIKEMKNE